MHNIKAIRADGPAFDSALARRGDVEPFNTSSAILARDKYVREGEQSEQRNQTHRNELAAKIGKAKRERHEGLAAELLTMAAQAKIDADRFEHDAFVARQSLNEQLASLPNLPAREVPDGLNELANVLVYERGAKSAFGFTPFEHDTLALRLGYDPDQAADIAGARFSVLKGSLARLHRALGQWMLDQQISNGFLEVNPPLIVNADAAFGTGQLPKFETDLFSTSRSLTFESYFNLMIANELNGNFRKIPAEQFVNTIEEMWQKRNDKAARLYLIPTAEVSLTNLVRDKILDADELPLRFTALTPCFRSEAGSAGRDTRGLIRQHQFEKVEMVSIVADQEAASAEHERMTGCAEGILDALGLAYRRMLLCAGDMGFAARKTYDLEVWLPGQGQYREISSVSDCGDFQARRMAARWKTRGQKGTNFVHTLNGSGLAVGRTLVAVLENYQRADGSVGVPEVLVPYMGGVTELVPS